MQTSCNRFASYDADPLYRRCLTGGKGVGFERNGCRTCAVKLSVPARRIQLIDFNLSGTDVNINVFVNETNCFPEEAKFDQLSVEQIVEKMETEQADMLSVIFKHYTMNEVERFVFPHYQRIADLFQWPNVCSMVKWLKEDTRKDKCVALIRALTEKPLA